MTRKFRLGLIINPVAGLGGSVALKGSDGVAEEAMALGAKAKATYRAKEALAIIAHYRDQVEVFTLPGVMGGDLATELGFDVCPVDWPAGEAPRQLGGTAAEDTITLARELQSQTIDLLLFVGGDGTARNVYEAVGESMPVLGVPAGVKIHSGVYAVTPTAAGKVLELLIRGELVTLMEADVMDIDEVSFPRWCGQGAALWRNAGAGGVALYPGGQDGRQGVRRAGAGRYCRRRDPPHGR